MNEKEDIKNLCLLVSEIICSTAPKSFPVKNPPKLLKESKVSYNIENNLILEEVGNV